MCMGEHDLVAWYWHSCFCGMVWWMMSCIAACMNYHSMIPRTGITRVVAALPSRLLPYIPMLWRKPDLDVDFGYRGAIGPSRTEGLRRKLSKQLSTLAGKQYSSYTHTPSAPYVFHDIAPSSLFSQQCSPDSHLERQSAQLSRHRIRRLTCFAQLPSQHPCSEAE